MDRAVKDLLDGIMSDQERGGANALSAVGLNSHDGPDLLDEMLNGDLGAPAAHSAKAEKHTAPDFKQLDGVMKSVLRGDSISAEGSLEDEGDEEQEAAPPSPPAKKEEEVPSWVGMLNRETQAVRDENQRQIAEMQRQNAWLMQQLQQRQQPAAPPDTLYEQFGVDPDTYQALRNQIRQEQQQTINQAMTPIVAQMSHNQFRLATNELSKSLEHFDKYYPPQVLEAFYQQLIQTKGLGVAMSTNWQAELTHAYRAADHERLVKEVAELKAKQAAPAESQKSKEKKERQEQKANLHLVPKAHAQGAVGRPTASKEIDNLPSNLGFKSFGREVFRKLYGN